jgi:hypothetical protein
MLVSLYVDVQKAGGGGIPRATLAGGARETDELILEFLLVRHFFFHSTWQILYNRLFSFLVETPWKIFTNYRFAIWI